AFAMGFDTADETDETDLFAATDEDAFARSRFGVVGLKHNLILDPNTYVRTVISASTAANRFFTDRYFNQDTPEEFIIDKYNDFDNADYRYTLSSFVNRKFNAKLTARAGILLENQQSNLFAQDREDRPDRDGDGIPDLGTLYDFDEGMNLVQAFVQTQYRLSSQWTLNTGLHGQWLTLNDAYALEPRVAINWSPSPKHRFNLGYGLHHQTVPLPILLLREDVGDGVFAETNRDLDFTRSNHFVLGYDSKFSPEWRAKVEVYYQVISNVPVESTPSSFSILNVGADFGFPTDVNSLVNEGTGRNYGLEFTLEKFFSRGYYGLLTASVFDSKYEGSDGIERNTAFNNGYVINLLAGKEWNFGKSRKNAFTIDTKFTYAGGRYYTPVDLESSRLAGVEQLKEELAFSERYTPYLRLDLKLGVKFNSNTKKLSHQFYLDFQNLTNRENIFVRRYNRQTNEVNEVFQTTFFPDFLYRIQF
ncbi:MAG: TonB-dependent receptor, partial [Bacteroidota bacterium]